MSTKRNLISRLRSKIREVNADSIYTNRFLWSLIMEHSRWIIKRDHESGRLYKNALIFQKIPCLSVKRVDKVDCPEVIKGEKIYRTVCKMPKTWETDAGPIVLRISSIDNFTDYKLVSSSSFENKRNGPFTHLVKQKYTFYEQGYLWFIEDPKKISIRALFLDDVSDIDCDCNKEPKDCVRFLDTTSGIPEYLEAEILSKCTQQLFGETERKTNDEEINSNVNRRN